MSKNTKDILEIRSKFESLARKIEDLSEGHKVYYYPSTGNLGDALIRIGTEQFFSDFGIKTGKLIYENERLIELDDNYRTTGEIKESTARNSLLLFGGGGGWCNLWTGARENTGKLSQIFRKVLVLPSTYETPISLENVTLYARDSYESMQSVKDALFCHDMAFYLLFSMPYAVHKNRSSKTAFCFRKDKESKIKEHWKIPLSNIDLSWKGNYLDSPLPMLEYVAEHKAVHTDRLHVAVACCLTGTKFYLYPGAYFKNKAIFKTTMDPYFDLGTWREDFPLSVKISNSLERKAKALFGSRFD